VICELCGKDVTFLRKVTIEGVQLEVCTECAKFGIEAKKETPKEDAPMPIVAQRLESRERRGKPKDVYDAGGKDELADDLGKRVRDARSKRGMTHKELAMKINEKVTVLSKVETGEMRPDDRLVRKLERELGIRLKEKVPETLAGKESKSGSLTLADHIRMQKGNEND
jgi:putative transcription factor